MLRAGDGLGPDAVTSRLHQQMIKDITIRSFGTHTQRDHVRQVREITLAERRRRAGNRTNGPPTPRTSSASISASSVLPSSAGTNHVILPTWLLRDRGSHRRRRQCPGDLHEKANPLTTSTRLHQRQNPVDTRPSATTAARLSEAHKERTGTKSVSEWPKNVTKSG